MFSYPRVLAKTLDGSKASPITPPIVLIECWKIANWNAERLLPAFLNLLLKFLDIFISTLMKSFIFCSSQWLTSLKKNGLKLSFKELLANTGEI